VVTRQQDKIIKYYFKNSMFHSFHCLLLFRNVSSSLLL